ncbi:MAG: glycosyltransferase, partial [Planctomycetes bacterium]|nr:glycosyltransferase [Planctomycetota bacterium]
MSETSSIRVLACIYDLRVGGAEKSLLEECRQISDFGIEISILCLGDDRTLEPEFLAAKIPVHFVPQGSKLSKFISIRRILRSGQYDLVHTLLFWPDIIVRPIARLVGLPVVSSLTNEYYGPEHRRNSPYGRWGVIAAQIADALTSQFASGYHAISARSAHIMSRRLGLRSSKISVIYRGRDLAHLGLRGAERRSAARASEGVVDETVFLCVGRQDYQKAHEVAIEGFDRVAGDFPNAVL